MAALGSRDREFVKGQDIATNFAFFCHDHIRTKCSIKEFLCFVVGVYEKLAKLQGKGLINIMILFVILNSGKNITLIVTRDYTVKNVKQKIEELEGIPVNKQRLVYITEEVHNDKKLEDYDFQSEGVMFLCMTLFVILLSGKKITLRVFGNDTVESVKEKIQELEGIQVSKQRLVYKTEELDKEKKLEDYDFQNEGTMYLCMTLFVVVLSGKTITLRVSRDDSVKNVKQKIQEREGIPVDEQRLVYTTYELRENHKKLPEYNVQNDGTMYLTMRLPG
ncbi:12915_t:CDS:2, partial [Funneliformis caledonium]